MDQTTPSFRQPPQKKPVSARTMEKDIESLEAPKPNVNIRRTSMEKDIESLGAPKPNVNIRKTSMRLLLTGGGTGGHVLPLVAVSRELKRIAYKQNTKLDVLYLGPDKFARQILEKEGIKCKFIKADTLKGGESLLNIIIGVFQAMWEIFRYMPDVIFSKGGYGSIPVVFVGALYFIPILIHESDSVPGKANLLAGRFAKKIAVSFKRTLQYFPPPKTAFLGQPIRREILYHDKNAAMEYLKFDSKKPTILILGGSQGAQKINDLILAILPDLIKDFQILHQCGENNYLAVKAEAALVLKTSESESYAANYRLFPFLGEKDFGQALAASDLIISRAGAGAIFEIAAAGKPSILIPYPFAAADHQRLNAYEYIKTSACEILEEENLTPNLFKALIMKLIENPEKLKKMSEASRGFANLAAGQIIAAELIKLALS